MFATRAGGSHCCTGIAIYDLGEAPELVFASWGGGGMGVLITGIEDLDQDGVFELVGREYLSDLYCTWPSAQIVLRYDGQEYVQAGSQFPHLYQDEIAEAARAAESGQEEAAAGYKCGGVVQLTLAYLYSGQHEKAWAEFYRLYKAADAEEVRGRVEESISASQFPPTSVSPASPE
jgi:hypothetical protein